MESGSTMKEYVIRIVMDYNPLGIPGCLCLKEGRKEWRKERGMEGTKKKESSSLYKMLTNKYKNKWQNLKYHVVTGTILFDSGKNHEEILKPMGEM